MFRSAAPLLVLLSLLTSASAQTPPTSSASPAPAKPAAKKVAPKAKQPAASKPQAADIGPCKLGVISVIGERYSVQKFGLTIFENEEAEGVSTISCSRG
ncbi:hypothetical protein [Bradyrhizobium sp. 199]|uniref:hypothetical protein n=1 Tax=Bradyrhizobium sp. 199 TaxID=2782664 RepID=UPI001FF9FF6A|nr:hypothetical protein [Bradyrhizobium sp. 199]